VNLDCTGDERGRSGRLRALCDIATPDTSSRPHCRRKCARWIRQVHLGPRPLVAVKRCSVASCGTRRRQVGSNTGTPQPLCVHHLAERDTLCETHPAVYTGCGRLRSAWPADASSGSTVGRRPDICRIDCRRDTRSQCFDEAFVLLGLPAKHRIPFSASLLCTAVEGDHRIVGARRLRHWAIVVPVVAAATGRRLQ
jgi:hypothetical protein